MNVLRGLDLWVVAFPSFLCLYGMVAATIYVFREESRARPRATSMRPAPSLTVLVPARNEEASLAACLEALLASEGVSFESVVVSDGSTDGTAAIARTFEDRGVRLFDLNHNVGKSRALQTALDSLATDLVMILDADTQVEPTTIREMLRGFFASDVVGVTANIRVRAARGLLAHLQEVEYASIIGLVKRANGAWGGLFTVSGAACCFRTAAVRAVGGFAARSVTEDIELSWRLQGAGGRLAYAPRALAHVSVPATLPALWRQRTRWSQGLMEVLRQQNTEWRGRRLALRVFALEALLSMSWLVLLAASLSLSTTAWIFGARELSWPSFGLWPIVSMTLFLCQSLTAAVFDDHNARVSWRGLPLVILYPLYFLVVVVPSALVGWQRGLRSDRTGVWERSARE